MKLFYGNVDFVKHFRQAGCPVTEIDFSQHSNTKDALKGLKEMTGVIILTNTQQIKINYEYLISRTLLNSNEKFVLLGDLRFDYYRELKHAMSSVVRKLSNITNTNRIIIASSMIEKDAFMYNIQPTNFDDYDKWLHMFEELVPFIDNEEEIIVSRARAYTKEISQTTLLGYINHYMELLDGKRQYKNEADPTGKPPVDPNQGGSLPEIQREEPHSGVHPEETEQKTEPSTDDEGDDLPF